MRVLVCGGREFADMDLMWSWLDRLHAHEPFTALCHGGARGADLMSGRWALQNGLVPRIYPVTDADWATYGKSAGHRRNAHMLADFEPELVVAFPHPTWVRSRGTRDMVSKALAANVTTVVAL